MDYNTKALSWDTERRIKRAKIIADEIIKAIPVKKYNCALDFGCGTGLISFNLINKFEHITLIDSSEGMIKKLSEKIQDSKVKNMTVLWTDINNDSLFQEKFDVIYTSMVLHHISDTKKTLENLYKLLNDGGLLCIIDLNEDDGSFHKSEEGFFGHNGFNQGELKGLFEGIGFRNVLSSTFYKDVKVINDTKIDYSLFLMVGEK